MIKKIIDTYKFLQQVRSFIPEAQAEDFWSKEDAKSYQAFMAGDTGQKLKHRMNNIIYYSAVKACGETQAGDYHRGIARGIQLLCSELDKHLFTEVAPHSDKLDSPESSPLDLVEVAS